MNKVFKGIWWFSVIGVFGVLMWVYASLPTFVDIYAPDLFKFPVQFGKDPFFYLSLGIIVGLNAILYAIGLWLSKKQKTLTNALSAWSFAFGITLNFFLIVALNTVNALNSNEKLNEGGIGALVIMSIVFLLLATLALPIVTIKNIKSK